MKPFTTKMKIPRVRIISGAIRRSRIGTQKGVQNSKEQRGADERSDTIVSNAADQGRSDHHGHGRDCPSKNKMSHSRIVELPQEPLSAVSTCQRALWWVKAWPTQSKSKWRKVQKNPKRWRLTKSRSTAPSTESSNACHGGCASQPSQERPRRSRPDVQSPPAGIAAPRPAKPPPRARPRAKTAAATDGAGDVGISDEEIRIRAYFISEWRRQNGVPGDSAHDWLEARRQLQEEAGKRG